MIRMKDWTEVKESETQRQKTTLKKSGVECTGNVWRNRLSAIEYLSLSNFWVWGGKENRRRLVTSKDKKIMMMMVIQRIL